MFLVVVPIPRQFRENGKRSVSSVGSNATCKAASAQDVDQVSADGSSASVNPMEFEELSDIIK